MKNIVLLVVWCVSVFACAQKQKEKISSVNILKKHIPEYLQEINASNFVSKIVENVKHYEKEPMYFMRPIQNNCVFELLVNDFPVYKDFGLEVSATPIEINNAILKSGEQTLTVRMYPLGDLLKDNYDTGNTIATLLDNTSMKIEVVKYDAYNISHQLSDEKIVLTHYSPTKEGSKKFIGAGLPYYEYTFSFNAKVPYENEGWLNGEDLTKFDKNDLAKAVEKAYLDTNKIYENQDIDQMARLIYQGELRNAVANYNTNSEELKEIWDWHLESINFENKVFFSLENVEPKFFGSGKIIALKNPSSQSVKRAFRGKSAFGFKYNLPNDKRNRGNWLDIYLYIPKGGTLADLQTIK